MGLNTVIAELRSAAASEMRVFFPIPLSASHTMTRFNGLVGVHVQKIAKWEKISRKFCQEAPRNHKTDPHREETGA
jgi:hypothetical protein